MKKTLFTLASAVLLISCGSNNSQEPSTATAVEEVAYEDATPSPTKRTSYSYTIVGQKEASMPLPDNQEIKKMTYTVEIPSEYSKYALAEIADVIKQNDNKHEYVFVEFYLASQPKTGPNYGIGIRTPSDNNTTVNYIAPPTPEAKDAKTPYDGCKVYGKWNMMGATVIAYQKNGNCYLVNYFGGNEYDEPERFIKTTYHGHTAFKNAEDPADMYVINSNGDLDGYFEGDLATTFPQAL